MTSPTENFRFSILDFGFNRGQSTLEYAVFTAVVSAALIAMTLYVRRSIQANLKVLEDQINAQDAG